MKKSRISLIALVASCSLFASVYGQWGWIPYAGPYIDMARDIASGDLGAIPYAGGYINLAQSIANGNFEAIPYAGGYIGMARSIANGNFGAIPYAGGYINMVTNYANTYGGGGGYTGYENYGGSIAENENLQPEYLSEGERMNTSEMGALFQAQEYYSPKWYEIVDMVSKLGDKGVIQTITPVISYEDLKSIDQEKVKLLKDLSGDSEGAQYYSSTNDQFQTFNIAKIMKDLREQRDAILELIRKGDIQEAKEAGDELKSAIKTSEVLQVRSLPCDMLILSISLEYARNLHREEAEEWATLAEDYMEGVEMPVLGKIKYWDYYATRFFISGSYSIAERLYTKSMKMREGANLPTGISESFLARLYQVQGLYEEAQERWEALKNNATSNEDIGEIQTNLGINAFFLGDNIEAEDYLKDALIYLEKESADLKDWKLPEDRQKFVDDLNKKQLGLPDNLNEDQEKEKASYEAATRELSPTPDIYVSSYLSGCCERLASIYIMQKRYDEAQKMIDKAEATGKNVYVWKEGKKDPKPELKREPIYGPFGGYRGDRLVKVYKWINGKYELVEKPDVQREVSINAIKVQMDLKKSQELGKSSKADKSSKAKLLTDALALCTKNIRALENNKDVVSAQRRAEAYKARSEVHHLIKNGFKVEGDGDFGSAETDLLEAARIIDENHCHETFMAEVKCSLGDVYLEEGNTKEAEKMFNEAEEICDEYFTSPSMYCRVYYGQAQVLYQQGKIEEAISKLEATWDYSLLVREKASTNAQQKAGIFGEYYYLYETLVEWQYHLDSEKKDPAKIYEAMERSRGQGLLDLMAAAGIKNAPEDLKEAEKEAGRKVNEARRGLVALRRQARQFQIDPAKMAEFNKQMEYKVSEIKDSIQELIKAKSAVVENSRSQIKIPAFDKAVEELENSKVTTFEYMVTEKGIYLFVYGYNKESNLYELQITEEQAAMFNEIDPTLEVKTGPLTAGTLGKLFQNKEHTGIIDSLQDPGSDEVKTAQELYLLYTILFPDDLGDFLEQCQNGEYAMILPDGVLAQFPFETLITNGDMEGFKDAAFLLEQDVTLFYSPSLEFYYHLQNSDKKDSKGVLTVGIKDYSAYNERHNPQMPQPVPTTLLAMRGADGSALPDLPGAEEESKEINRIYGKNSTQLLNQEATEKNVRNKLEDKKQSFHFAGHAQAMYQYGKLAGKLILYPDSKENDVSNDGFLTLEELCEIDENINSRLLDGYKLVFLPVKRTLVIISRAKGLGL